MDVNFHIMLKFRKYGFFSIIPFLIFQIMFFLFEM